MIEDYHSPAASNPDSTMARAALTYADHGIPVFPCRPDKKPYTAHGFKDATTDHGAINEWWKRWPDAIIGIPTGKATGLLVLDVDDADALAALEAEHGKLSPTLTHRTGRGGRHYLYRYRSEAGVVVRNSAGLLAPGIDIRGEGGYIVAPPSTSQKGPYTVLDARPLSDTPAWLLQALRKPQRASLGSGNPAARGPVGIDTAGPTIPDGGRNHTLTRIAGTLHDGTRNLEALTRDLLAVNDARCTPPLPEREVAKIAASIHTLTPCKPRPKVTPRVLSQVEDLRTAADARPVRGMAGASGWKVYMAGLDACERFGREHPEGIALTLDARTWAQVAGTEASTVSRWVRRSPLVRVLDRGSGRRAKTVLFVAPNKGVQLQHSSTHRDSKEPTQSRSVATDPLLRPLYRSRWSKRGHKPRRGVVAGTRMVRQTPTPQVLDGVERMGPSRAALLWKIRSHPNASRADLAAMLGVKPESLKKRLRWLQEAGMIVRTSRGHYAPATDLERRVEDARVLGGEPEADRQQIARHERERDGWRRRNENRADPAPTERSMRNVRESYPKRRRDSICAAIAALFEERPEYRTRRVGQITARLVHYIGPDFPRGRDGAPKDHEVEAILNGVAV